MLDERPKVARKERDMCQAVSKGRMSGGNRSTLSSLCADAQSFCSCRKFLTDTGYHLLNMQPIVVSFLKQNKEREMKNREKNMRRKKKIVKERQKKVES